MTVLTDIAALHTAASRSVPPQVAAPRMTGPQSQVGHSTGASAPLRRSAPAQDRERRLNRDALARAPHRPAASACVVRPAARPVRFLVVLGLATAITVVLLAMLGAVSGGGAAAVPETTTVTQVRSGETLWDVAQRTAPGADTAVVLDRIQELNQLSSGAVRAGQPITVPAAS